MQKSLFMGAGMSLVTSAQGHRDSIQDKLNIGIIGVANRGGDNLNGVASQNIVALCDVDDNYLAQAKQRFPQAMVFNDYRKMIEMKGLDAVTVSTPDHHHAPATALALHAGLHVYCEKPLTLTIGEGRPLIQNVNRYGRVCQVGSQQRSDPLFRRACELVQIGRAHV